MRFSALGLPALLVSAATVFAQTAPSPSAYVYVSSTPPGQNLAASRVYEFSAASNGVLSPIAGSPLASPVYALALNGKWLFGTYSNGGQNPAIYSYSIAANGSLKQADITQVAPAYNGPVTLTLDHTGNSLYSGWNRGAGDNGYEAFSIDQTNGALSALNGFYTNPNAEVNLSFVGNNQYAYGASCYHLTPDIYGFARLSDGSISQVGMNAPLPPAPPNDGYCPGTAMAADPYNDVVLPLFQYSTGTNNPGKPQLAVYTADKYGKLSTTSTYQNMPTPAVEPDFLALSPSGYYLAVTGYNGLQVFLMHGSNAPTALTSSILPGTSMGKAVFDNRQHLYVLGTNNVYVFNISTKGITQAPGSPFTVPYASQLIVLPK